MPDQVLEGGGFSQVGEERGFQFEAERGRGWAAQREEGCVSYTELGENCGPKEEDALREALRRACSSGPAGLNSYVREEVKSQSGRDAKEKRAEPRKWPEGKAGCCRGSERTASRCATWAYRLFALKTINAQSTQEETLTSR